MASEEVWKPVVGFEGRYEVSNMGRVRSLDRIVTQKSKKNSVLKRVYRGRILRYIIRGKIKRYGVCLYKDNIPTLKLVSRLVAEAFIPNPENKPEVDHIDTNPFNDRVDNLKWVTHQENCMNPLTREHISKAKMGHPDWNKPWTDERRKAASERWKGRIITTEARKKISESLKRYNAQKRGLKNGTDQS